MVKIPPFRVFVQPAGIPSSIPLSPEPSGNTSNLFLDAPTLAYWYWMLSGLTIDLGYTVNGGIEVPIRHRIHLDAQTVLPQKRIHEPWSISKNQHDDNLDITTFCWLWLNQPRCSTLPQSMLEIQKKYQDNRPPQHLLWSHTTPFISKDTRFGICFKFIEYADNRDFTIYTIANDGQGVCVGSFNAHFLNQDVPFYVSTPYPKEIAIRIDFVHISPEFFEIVPPTPP